MHERLRADGETEADIYDRRSYLAHVLREHVKSEVEKQAEQGLSVENWSKVRSVLTWKHKGPTTRW